VTLIEIRPHRWGWKVFEAPGVEPVFPEKAQAINYAQNRASFRSGEIRILDSSGSVEHNAAHGSSIKFVPLYQDYFLPAAFRLAAHRAFIN